MSSVVNIHEAKTHLSRLLDQVAAGAVIIIAKAGKPLARLSPISPAAQPKKHGLLKGKIRIPKNFNAADKDIEWSFYGH